MICEWRSSCTSGGVRLSRKAFLLLLAASFGFAASPKISRDLATVPADRQVSVIVRYTHQPEARHHARMTRQGGKLNRALDLIHSAAYTLPVSALADLENDPDVEYVAPDRPVA